MARLRPDRARLVAEAERRLASGDADTAHELFLQVRSLGLRSVDVLLGLAKSSLSRRFPLEAEYWFQLAAQEAPSSAEVHLGLGTARYHLGLSAEAIQSYLRALEIAPDLEGAGVSLAVAYLKADFPALALGQADRSLTHAPGNIDLRLTRASALIKLGRAAEAVPDLVWAHDQGGKLGEVGLLECEVNRALGDFETALMLAAELSEVYPTLSAPLQMFRTTFAEFVAAAPITRVDEFLNGLGLPRHRMPEGGAARSRSVRARQPKTDVIVPVHDGLDCLKDCLASLERHASTSLGKIILVNDCSSARTRGWLRRLMRSRTNIEVVHTRKRAGFTRALALGLAHSRAKRFVALNSDCIVSQGWLERLGTAMDNQGRVAMVGPLSNNAGWQSLGVIFDADGNYADNPLGSVEEVDHTQRRLELLKMFDAPDACLVHGFCVLVDRAIYEGLGGLDAGLFPRGYGEFQDLSLRALDAGYALKIADDCFVGHVGGGSISAEHRAALSREARGHLYARHTALRYLSAECSAVLNPQVEFVRRRAAALGRYHAGEVSLCKGRAKVTIHGDAKADMTGQRVCIFVCYAPDGNLLPYTLHHLSELKAQGFQTVLVLNEVGKHRLPPEVRDLARIVMLRDNRGYDFGAWRDAVARFPSVWGAETLLFTNDSIVGPFHGYGRLFERIDSSTASLFFLTESAFAEPHLQSFFWGVKGEGLSNPVFRTFMASILDLADKTSAIFLYEIFLRHICEKLGGMTSLCLFPLIDLTGADSSILPTFNPTHHLWRELLRAGCPFLKADFCRKNATGADAAAWLAEITALGGDPMLVRLHVEALQIQRRLG